MRTSKVIAAMALIAASTMTASSATEGFASAASAPRGPMHEPARHRGVGGRADMTGGQVAHRKARARGKTRRSR